jgi:hypothetical protein
MSCPGPAAPSFNKNIFPRKKDNPPKSKPVNFIRSANISLTDEFRSFPDQRSRNRVSLKTEFYKIELFLFRLHTVKNYGIQNLPGNRIFPAVKLRSGQEPNRMRAGRQLHGGKILPGQFSRFARRQRNRIGVQRGGESG